MVFGVVLLAHSFEREQGMNFFFIVLGALDFMFVVLVIGWKMDGLKI